MSTYLLYLICIYFKPMNRNMVLGQNKKTQMKQFFFSYEYFSKGQVTPVGRKVDPS